MIYYYDDRIIIHDDSTELVRSAGGSCPPELAACWAATICSRREYRDGQVVLTADSPSFLAIDEIVEGTRVTFMVRQPGMASVKPSRFVDDGGSWSFEAPTPEDLLVSALGLLKYLGRGVCREDEPSWWATVSGNRVVFPGEGDRFEVVLE